MSPAADDLLALTGVTKTFKRFVALDDVSLGVPDRQRRAIIGPNGAGKSTLINIIGGQLRPDNGEIRFAGTDLLRVPPYRRPQRGIGRTFQISNTFTRLTALENVLSALNAASSGALGFSIAKLEALDDRAIALLVEVELAHASGETVDRLSHGDRKRLELAMILALEPRLLLLDEPTAGMGLSERRRLVDLISRVVEQRGMTLVFVEHDIDTVFRIAEHITVMARGAVFAEGPPDAVAGNEEVQRIYLGGRMVS